MIDLSMQIKNNMVFYPGDPKPEMQAACDLKKDGCRVMKLCIGTHTGTHVDAPSHFIKDGKTIDELGIDNFQGRGVVIDVTGMEAFHEIVPDDLQGVEQNIRSGDVVLFRTDWTNIHKSDIYTFRHPYISADTAEIMRDKKVKAVGVDMFNVDRTYTDGELYPDNAMKAHEILLGNSIVIIENLINLDKIDFDDPLIIFFPLNICRGDGSPVRAAAINCIKDIHGDVKLCM